MELFYYLMDILLNKTSREIQSRSRENLRIVLLFIYSLCFLLLFLLVYCFCLYFRF